MDGLFIENNDEIVISFAIGKHKEGRILADISEEDLREVYGENVEDIEEHTATFRRPSFADIVDMGASLSTHDGVSVDFNPWSIRYARMKTLIKRWTLKDEDGKEIEPTDQALDKLNPSVATVIGIQLDNELGMML